MKRMFTRLLETRILTLLPVLGVALLLLPATRAGAAMYDEFSGTTIDAGTWTNVGAGFSQPGDGYVHFSAAGSAPQSMTSTARYTSGIFTMLFSDYASNNNAPSAQGLGSVVGFGLGSRLNHNWMRIERGQVQSGGYVEVNWVNPNEAGYPIHVNWLPSNITSGMFQLVYDGADVTFFYRTNPADPWTQMVQTNANGQPVLVDGQPQPLVITPGWGSGVPMFIDALTGGVSADNYSLGFKVDYVDVASVPEPFCILFLAAGLVSVAAAKGRLVS